MLELFLNAQQKKRSKKGFTLIELIIVIAILAILVAILVPSMSGYLDSARESTGETNARTLFSAAAAAAATEGDTAASIGTLAAPVAVSGLTAAGFQTKLVSLLGPGFNDNFIAVTLDGNNNVTGAAWQEAAGATIYTYEP